MLISQPIKSVDWSIGYFLSDLLFVHPSPRATHKCLSSAVPEAWRKSMASLVSRGMTTLRARSTLPEAWITWAEGGGGCDNKNFLLTFTTLFGVVLGVAALVFHLKVWGWNWDWNLRFKVGAAVVKCDGVCGPAITLILGLESLMLLLHVRGLMGGEILPLS